MRPLVFRDTVDTTYKYSLFTPELLMKSLKTSSTYFLVANY